MSWNSSVMQFFFEKYLIQNRAVKDRQGDNVLYCPTQDWHREALNDPTGTGGAVYVDGGEGMDASSGGSVHVGAYSKSVHIGQFGTITTVDSAARFTSG